MRLPENILSLLSEQFLGSDCTADVAVRRIASTQNSDVYRADFGARRLPIVLKRVKSNDAARQFRALQLAHASLEGTRFSVPTPHALLESHNLICMEYFAAPSLSSMLRSRTLSQRDKAVLVGRAGSWLDLFHRVDGTSGKEVALADRVRFVSELTQSRHPGTVEKACRWLLAHAPASLRISHGSLHGDFTADNVLISGDKTVVIDIGGTKGQQIVDAVQFLNNLLLMNAWKRASVHWPLEQAFIDTYFERRSMPSLHWWRLFHLVQYWQASRVEATLRARARCVVIGRALARLLRHIEGNDDAAAT